jgi:hypothetical protein
MRAVLLTLLLAGLAATAPAQSRFDFDDTRTVLPKTVLPRHYTLSLQLDPRSPAARSSK